MSEQIVEESRFLLYCFLSGIVITMVYDVFRIFRRVFRHGNFWIALEDIFFWTGAGIFLFYMLYIWKFRIFLVSLHAHFGEL